jgi:hypothetical protein
MDDYEWLQYAQRMLRESLDAQYEASKGGKNVSPTEIARRHEAADWSLVVLALEKVTR